MELAAIKQIVDQWNATGQLSDSDRQQLKAQYLQDIGATPDCTTCSAFWSDVRHHFNYYLKLNFPVKNNASKYMVIGPFRPAGFGAKLVNGKGDGVNTIQITDEIAEQLLKEEPAYAEVIVLIPTEEAANEAETGEDEDAQKKS